MSHSVIAGLATALAASPIAVAQAQEQPTAPERHLVEAVAEYPHDQTAFTQGLFVFDGVLYESTGQVGESRLREVDLESGDTIREVRIPPPYFGEGSARIGDEIYMLSWQAQTGFIFNAETLEQVDSFSYPGEGWGLTTNGEELFLSDGSSQIRVLDPATMELKRLITVTLNGRYARRINELEWVDGEIWANIWMTALIIRIDPETGEVIGLVDLSPVLPDIARNNRDATPNGIAWNAETGQIYVTGKLWPSLYEIQLVEAE